MMLSMTSVPFVAGTPMHHAAMANKKEMMFTLARLGCDWRARADGIDGATAAFVLCGQHGKTTRQQVSALQANVLRYSLSGILCNEQRLLHVSKHVICNIA